MALYCFAPVKLRLRGQLIQVQKHNEREAAPTSSASASRPALFYIIISAPRFPLLSGQCRQSSYKRICR